MLAVEQSETRERVYSIHVRGSFLDLHLRIVLAISGIISFCHGTTAFLSNASDRIFKFSSVNLLKLLMQLESSSSASLEEAEFGLELGFDKRSGLG